jgi:predicted nucleic acid-binding protein
LTLFLDTSALLKRYVVEPESDAVSRIMERDARWVAANHTYTEVSIALTRRLGIGEAAPAIRLFEDDWIRTVVVDIDDPICRRAADLGIEHHLRTLDALHLAAAERAGGSGLTFLTFDTRLGDAARSMGFPVAVI